MDSHSIPSLQSFNSQVPNSRSLLSCPSEPPDVGNWFSSYEYRSPNPDSNFSLEESAFRVRESERDEERVEEEEAANFEKIRTGDEVVEGEKLVQCSSTCVKDDKHNEDLSLPKGLDSFSSRSLLSEPPDIRNWFSSYAYESCVSDTSSLFSDLVSKENECEEKRFDFEVINEYEGRSENVHPKGCVEHNSSSDKNMRVKQTSSRGDGSVEMKKNLTTANTSHLEKILQPCMQDKTLQHNLGSTNSKYEETLSLNHGSPGCNREAHLMSLDIERSSDYNCMRPPGLVHKNDIRDVKSKSKIEHDKLDMSASLAKSFSARSSTCTRNKENAGDMNSMHGFVTARKNRCTGANDENSWKKPEKMLLQCSTNTGTVPLSCEKHAVTKRKALTEATNLQQSKAMEITGKWQCPQKGKPNLGPALKQLRLERWVHRV